MKSHDVAIEKLNVDNGGGPGNAGEASRDGFWIPQGGAAGWL